MTTFNRVLLDSAWTLQAFVEGTIVTQALIMDMGVRVYIQNWRPRHEVVLLTSVSCPGSLLTMVGKHFRYGGVIPGNFSLALWTDRSSSDRRLDRVPTIKCHCRYLPEPSRHKISFSDSCPATIENSDIPNDYYYDFDTWSRNQLEPHIKALMTIRFLPLLKL